MRGLFSLSASRNEIPGREPEAWMSFRQQLRLCTVFVGRCLSGRISRLDKTNMAASVGRMRGALSLHTANCRRSHTADTFIDSNYESDLRSVVVWAIHTHMSVLALTE